MNDLSDWSVVIGRVRTAYGIRGQLKVLPLCDDPQRFAQLTDVCVAFADGRREMASVVSVTIQGDEIRLALRGVEDRTAAEGYRHAELRVRPEMRVPLPEGQYYVDDLLGLRVVTMDGRELGTIRDVLLLPAHDVYVTEHAMIPAVREVIRSVDLAGGVITVDPPAGLAPELGI
ncbi:MAG TPA: ribosome maturation factor RimM [Armatimonadota bacterium]|nr:ribosome maturation factor RimM [Armatimonadota bacterium]